ncbi:MAG TPA: DUF11 domain-containing protein [Chloroflexi bacterium]|nr:DUF11 domain-containing protein [Chloroflexota bacterium]
MNTNRNTPICNSALPRITLPRFTSQFTMTPSFSLVLAILLGVGFALTLSTVAAQSLPQAQGPDFSTAIKTGPLYAHPGDRITYTIVAINTGESVANVVLTDALPAGVMYVPASCRYDTGSSTWPCSTSPTDPANELWQENFTTGDRITTTFAVTVLAGTLSPPLINRADLVWSGGRQPLSTTTMIVSAIPDFSASYKSGTPGAEVGQTVAYTIVVINSGDPVTGVVLSETIPAGLGFTDCHYDIGGGSTDLPCTPPTLWTHEFASGGRITTTLQFTVTAGTLFWPIQNCALVRWKRMSHPLCFTTLSNPTGYIYLPIVMRNYRHDNYEPNNALGQAYGPLGSGKTYYAYIWDALDQDDFYHFTPVTTGTVDITLSNIPAGCDYDLYVYYSAGSNDYPLVAQSRQAGNADEHTTFTPVASRQHFIRIYRFEGYSNEQPYHLRAIYH